MKTSAIKYSMVLAAMLLSAYLKAQVSFTHNYNGTDCAPVTVTFTNTSSFAAWEYFQWYFEGDGPYTVFDTSYIFTQGGWYQVRLEKLDSNGIIGSTQQNLNIVGAQLGMSADSACPGDEIYFNLQTQGGNISDNQIFWDFGDGNTAYGWDVNHAYPLGNYTVTLIVDAGCGIDTITKSIKIGNAIAPVANINIWPTPVCPNDVVELKAWGTAGSFYWTFGDGNDTILTDPNVEHAYITVGTKTVTMAVTNGCGLSDSATATVNVQNGLAFTDQINYEIRPDSACPGDGVQFDCWDCDKYPAFSWNFGDGSPLNTTDTRASHSYSTTGSYIITLTVLNGCGNAGTFTNTVVIANNVAPDPIDYENAPLSPIACPNDSILFYAQGGAVSYFWDFGDGNTDSLTSVLEGTDAVVVSHAYIDTGTYTVTFTLTNGCGFSFTNTYNVYISDTASIYTWQGDGPPAFFWPGLEGDNPVPSGTCEEIMFASLVSGATFSWNWGDGNNTITNTYYTTHAYNLPGTYTISLFVQNSCGDTATFTNNITIEGICPLLAASASGSGPTCKSKADGSAIATVSGGKSPYTYLWNDPAGQTTASATGLPDGAYTVSVTDSAGDNVTATVTLTALFELSISVTVVNASCGGNDGFASASATGGTALYTYQWSNGVLGSGNPDLSAGFYIVTVTDANGCSDFALATISDANGPIVNLVSTTDANCNGTGGAINISISQGTSPFTYLWSNGAVTQDISNLSAGPYEVNVTDANGCLGLKSVTVSGQDAFSLTTTATDANCGSANGSATVSVSGGTGPYTYLWNTSPAQTAAAASNLTSGAYVVTVTDANSCVGSATAAVGDIGGPIVTVDSILNAVCGVGGSVYITVTGGTPSYTYLWSNSSITEDLVGVQPGTYSVIVSGADNCKGGVHVVIDSKLPPRPDICLVTVDSASGMNLCVFEKDSAAFAGVDYVNFYKESTQSGVFYWIGSKSADSLSQWLDLLSDSEQRAWKYKLAAVDSCGNESAWSSPHKTMHLTTNLGLNNVINLLWDHYEGFAFLTYDIYRHTNISGWELIGSIQNYLTSFTDTAPPQGQLFYQVVANHPDGCIATKKADDYNSSRSNTSISVSPSGVDELGPGSAGIEFRVYPNPSASGGAFTLEILNPKSIPPMQDHSLLSVYDVLGREIYQSEIFGKQSVINLSGQSPGIYHLQVITDKQIGNKKLIIE